MQHHRFPISVASRDTLCPPPPRAREAELPTAQGEGGGSGVSVGGMGGVVSGGGVVGCPCGLGLARRRQLALISMFAYVAQRQNGPLWRTKYPCAQFRTSNTCGGRWGPPNVLPNKDIPNPIPIPIRMYLVHPYWRIYPCTGFRDEMSIKGERAAFRAARDVQRSGAGCGYWGVRPSRTRVMGSECAAR